MRKAFWLAVGAYLVPTFMLGYVWHLELLEVQYQRLGLYRDDVIIPFGIVSMIVQAVFFARVYPRLFSTEHGAWAGNALRFGATFSVLAWSFTTLPVAAKYQMTAVVDFIVLETGFTVAQFLIVSPLIALSYRGAPAAASGRMVVAEEAGMGT